VPLAAATVTAPALLAEEGAATLGAELAPALVHAVTRRRMPPSAAKVGRRNMVCLDRTAGALRVVLRSVSNLTSGVSRWFPA
jgi:hypothetical protein